MFDFALWEKEHDKEVTDLLIKYYRQLEFHYRISDDALEHIKDAFVVGYKRGLHMNLSNELDYIAKERHELLQQEHKLNRRAGKLDAKERRLKEARNEILELKRGLLASFTIKEITEQEEEK